MRRQGVHDTDELTTVRAQFIFKELSDPRLRSVNEFVILFVPFDPITPGPDIRQFANIFDRFVGTSWTVRVDHNIDGRNNPGWRFTK